jgi:HAE1 family hydrophobic/amphiphilic exporter-1
MLILAVVVAGVTAYGQLGIDRFPNIDLPSVRVQTVYPGAASAEVESEVTQPLEDAVATVAGLDELRSISNDGVSMLFLTFRLDQNINVAAQDVRDAISAVLNRLPPDIDPPVVQKQDLDASPIMSLAVSGPRDTRELYFLADRYVKSTIESARGVGQVNIEGAVERAIQINVDAEKLAAYRMSIMQVHDAIVAQNAEVPGGRVDAGFRELSLRTLGRVPDSQDFNQLVVATVDNVPVRIGDLGEAVDLTKERRTLALFDGKPAVVLQVQRQSGMNTVEVIDAVKQRINTARALLPPDIEVSILQDQSRYIRAALHEIQNHLISGSIMASVIVLIFMRSWRSTLIAAVAIPTSIIGAFAAMKALDFTMNNVTMLALVLMVGVVIDDAIIVLENVFRMAEEKGLAPIEATIEGTREIGLAVLATTLSLVIVFLPVSFLSSVTGRLLYEFGITASVAVMISMLVSFSLTPMMCSRMLKGSRSSGDRSREPASRRGYYHWIESSYMFFLRQSMRFRWAVMLLVVAVIASNVPLYQLVPQDYIPTDVDESEFEARISAPEGVSTKSMEEMVRVVQPQVMAVPGVEHVLTTVGGGGGIRSPSNATMYIRLTDIEARTFSWRRLWKAMLAGDPQQASAGNFKQSEKMREVRRIIGQYPELRASVRNLTSFRQGAPVDVDFVVTGPDLLTLADFSARLRDKVTMLPTLVDVDVTLRMDKPNLLAHIDRERAAALGVPVQEIANTLRVAVGGDDRVSRFYDAAADDAYDVELRLVGVDRADTSSISQLYVRAMQPAAETDAAPLDSAEVPLISGLGYDGRSTPLTRIDNVVRFAETFSPSRIDRLDRQRMTALRANLAPGYSLAQGIAAVRGAAEELGLPPGYSVRVMGRARELENTLREFVWTCGLSFICMYIVLAAQYEHLIHPITILLSLPIAVPFGLLSLWIGGETLNLYSALGILVLFGMVKKASILQVDHINQLRAAGMPRAEAILVGNRDRLRPILMTAIAFIAGMIPLLIATGPGAEERRSIAVLVVGGMALSLLLTLLAVPVIYSILDDFGGLFRRRWRASASAAAISPKSSPGAPKSERPIGTAAAVTNGSETWGSLATPAMDVSDRARR